MKYINNWINGKEVKSNNGEYVEKYNPHTGMIMSYFANSTNIDVNQSVDIANSKFSEWKNFTPIKRGEYLNRLVELMRSNSNELANCFASETGKIMSDAVGELNGAIKLGEFFSGEGMRMYGKTMTSNIIGKQIFSIREPRGVAGLIVPANTPIANIAWKTFPALLCGNTVVLKSSEDAPEIALEFAKLTKLAGIPDGVFNVIHGIGKIAGEALVANVDISTISFTGSTEVGKTIASICSKRLARVSLELGGKNPFIVCEDADIDNAVHWALLSTFSNAGQRCAATSKIIVMNEIYDTFVQKLTEGAEKLVLGTHEGANLGPLISLRQQKNIKEVIEKSTKNGSRILCGGYIPKDQNLKGYYFLPTLIDNVNLTDEVYLKELFAPVATIHRVSNLNDGIKLANDTEYGLTSAIHTKDINKAMFFSNKIKAGVANINFGTFGSEPHMPFGGFGLSGNGTREPGVEAIDVYSEMKNVSILMNNQSF